MTRLDRIVKIIRRFDFADINASSPESRPVLLNAILGEANFAGDNVFDEGAWRRSLFFIIGGHDDNYTERDAIRTPGKIGQEPLGTPLLTRGLYATNS